MSQPNPILPIAYSCGVAQIVAIPMIPYNLIYAAKHKIQAIWIRNRSSIEDSQQQLKVLQKEVDSGLSAAACHARCAVPLVGTLWQISQSSSRPT